MYQNPNNELYYNNPTAGSQPLNEFFSDIDNWFSQYQSDNETGEGGGVWADLGGMWEDVKPVVGDVIDWFNQPADTGGNTGQGQQPILMLGGNNDWLTYAVLAGVAYLIFKG